MSNSLLPFLFRKEKRGESEVRGGKKEENFISPPLPSCLEEKKSE